MLVGVREEGKGRETCLLARGGGRGAVRGAELGEGAKLGLEKIGGARRKGGAGVRSWEELGTVRDLKVALVPLLGEGGGGGWA